MSVDLRIDLLHLEDGSTNVQANGLQRTNNEAETSGSLQQAHGNKNYFIKLSGALIVKILNYLRFRDVQACWRAGKFLTEKKWLQISDNSHAINGILNHFSLARKELRTAVYQALKTIDSLSLQATTPSQIKLFLDICSKYTHFKSLELLEIRLTKNHWEEIAKLSHLTRLSLLDSPDVTTVNSSSLGCLPHLREIRFRRCNFSPNLVELVDNVSATTIEFSQCKGVTRAVLQSLKENSSLQSLSLAASLQDDNDPPAELHALLQNRSITQLDLSSNSVINYSTIAVISKINTLQMLSLSNCSQIDDRTLVFLKKMTNLTSLNLEATKVSNDRAKEIRNALPQLKRFSHSEKT